MVEYKSTQVIVLPIIEQEYVVLHKVRRQILGGAVWELPAGGIQENEHPEETGVSITDISRLIPENTLVVSAYRLPMFSSIYSVNVSENEFDDRSMHDDEVESPNCFSINTIKAMMSSGEIVNSITLAILRRFILGQDFHTVNLS